jgi:hypothetical protein
MTQISCDLAEPIQCSKYCSYFLIMIFSLSIYYSIFRCRLYVYRMYVSTVNYTIIRLVLIQILQDNPHTYTRILVQAQLGPCLL